ncbi:MAG: endonuclease/exonuclease/phosphatase family protein [Ignavibacteria bacterium]|nr:endonuclease/exonuclease/phosphatase family protein [Ignavibacteria bacterium]MBT8381221.1 endonuclease/exonuclease/phosphatase family protein [Ignavibacteria bacterium]MBT8392111.1 endonuclease/exonuclease/phosphatase family protein [Ignavibacteria bacterium]NNJ53898.1 T9SS type A sorting domain-containing protein [Ignavibacteriaceae bacterium]NNL22647.1 T9SS type A sorting domain-containing protein [Ignavibacteriaceae bacterium]
MKLAVIITISFLMYANVLSQSLPIFLDGRTDDWNVPVPTYIDAENDGNLYDFKYISVTNDEQFLFIRIRITPFLKLIEDNQFSLYVDGDNNSSTGFSINGIGAELRFDFGERSGINYHAGGTQFNHPDIQFRSMPTVTDTTFEFAIGRQFIPPNSGTGAIKLFFIDGASNGDWMPNSGQTFEYTFDDTPTPTLITTEISREDTSLLRIMNWNVLWDGLLDPQREDSFERILQALQPDIICFNEFFNSSATKVKNAINQMLPLPGGASWSAVKLDAGNVTLSKYPIVQSWLVYSDHRITASLINLPQRFERDILVINCHYKCCGGVTNDETRQREADATIAFILDAKTPGGIIDLPSETPFVMLGDFNLVGDRQQLITLTTGEIINTQLFGNGGAPDWDDTDLDDILSQQSDKRTAYTWRNDQSSFPPGRLDFQIYSNSVMSVEKNFVIQSEVMSQNRLNQYGFQMFDTETASDHLPKVTDFSFDFITNANDVNELNEFKLEQNYPNPFNPKTNIGFRISESGFVRLRIYDVLGNEFATLLNEEIAAGEYEIEFSPEVGVPSGIYYYQLNTGNYVDTKKMILLK